jgi:uncharacterized protein YpbB
MNPSYKITPKGNMVMDLTESMGIMYQEQREAFFHSLKEAVQRMERGDTDFQVAFHLVETLAIAGLVPSAIAEDRP